MGMLELGRTRSQKRKVSVLLTALHLLALGALVALFWLAGGPPATPLGGALLVVATTLWLLSFVLLCVNVAYYVFAYVIHPPRGRETPSERRSRP
ncbi:hypothetical protein [Truepera radiovictrix]|uniref:Uncharacterized protein n=1 Tax=Truepera radiovictrix (strain DSM 17093 / CIP 108686 / LMG 22925 / RQ-24) TaxID=649638 RepID=D7CWK3_TRURR|nr:hypothetical protein [Truepera radiovictrix]ADI14402.1 hypothetical protein Trad_1279 [Truepera radiovictrix DSM 17093]WMT57041.1 hypothetical protein RCV51_13610 [Truepera radiovictrix]